MDSLREYQILRRELKQKQLELKEIDSIVAGMLKNFNSDDDAEVVSYSNLQSLEMGVPYHVNDKVKFIKLESGSPDRLLFITHMKAGGIFGKQSHDVVEKCRVVKGHLIEALRGDLMYHKGTSITYDKFEVHKPYTDVDSIYHVTFYAPDANTTPSKT